MAERRTRTRAHTPRPTVLKWLLDGDPAIRWQVMADLLGLSTDVVAAERARVATDGWGAEILRRQRPDGQFGDGHWATNLYALVFLRALGLDPAGPQARQAVALVKAQVTWGPEFGNSPFFAGEVEPCINGHTLLVGAYFGETSERLVERLLGEQLKDGGWNCEAERGSVRSSFHTTICVLEGLLEYERAKGRTRAVTAARKRAHDYLLERHLLRRLSTGQVISQAWTRFVFPPTWHYDVLRALDYFRRAGIRDDRRLREAVALVETRMHQNGRWPAGPPHDDPVKLDFGERRGSASRWNTLRALRVLAWFGAASSTSRSAAPSAGPRARRARPAGSRRTRPRAAARPRTRRG